MSSIDSVIQDPSRIAAVRELGVLNSGPHAPLDRLTRLAAGAVEAPVASISLVDGEREYFVAAHGVPALGAGSAHCPVEHSICRFTIAGGAPLRLGDVREHPQIPGPIMLGDLEVVSYLGVPLSIDGGSVVGALCVVDGRRREWTEPEVAVLTELAGEITRFLAMRTRVLHRVMHDTVTGVPGETLFLARCDATRGRPRPGRSAMYCVDLSARTRLGRSMGSRRAQDAALRGLVSHLAGALGSTDILGRLPGDVFGVFAHELADERAALRMAGRMRAALRESAGPGDASAARIGIALCDAPAETAADMVRRAAHVMHGAAVDGSGIEIARRAA